MEEITDPSKLAYDARGLIPCVVQQYDTGEVLMVAWMNEESVGLTLKTGTTWFWSRSRQELWNKGATSGNMQQVKELWSRWTLRARLATPAIVLASLSA
jgi:phosphoribosyl-AMP cyclohydrolase/phosphoribosyl-ATP pyrophosphohydrolase/phosphoribosyl-AMP cyclohydrolase